MEFTFSPYPLHQRPRVRTGHPLAMQYVHYRRMLGKGRQGKGSRHERQNVRYRRTTEEERKSRETHDWGLHTK